MKVIWIKILLNKTLRVFLYIEIICISIMILVSGAGGFIPVVLRQ